MLADRMEALSAEHVRSARARIPLIFLTHQVLGAWGVTLAAFWVLTFVTEFARHFGYTIYIGQVQRILYGTPYFPMQVGFALFLGWVLGGTLRHGSMVWVWVFPFAALLSALVGFPLIGHIAAARYTGLGFSSRLSYFFGWGNGSGGIQPSDRTVAMLPFYCATAYTLGALLARRMVRMPVFFETMRGLRKKRLILFVGAPWFSLKLALDSAYYPVLRTWPVLRLYLQGLLVISIFLTFVLGIAVSLVGPQFSVTRFFLKPTESRGE